MEISPREARQCIRRKLTDCCHEQTDFREQSDCYEQSDCHEQSDFHAHNDFHAQSDSEPLLRDDVIVLPDAGERQ
jgi:hypothetical protein